MKTDVLLQVKIISVFIVALFIVLVLWAVKMAEINNSQRFISNKKVTEILGTPIPLAEEGTRDANGLITTKYYKNENYGFELEYPKAWAIESADPADIFIQPPADETSNLPIPHEGALEIKVRAADPKTGLSKLTAQYSEDGIDAVAEKAEIGGVPALKIMTNICRADNCRITEWFVLKNNYLYHISSIYPDVAYDKNFDRIISTLKFSGDVK